MSQREPFLFRFKLPCSSPDSGQPDDRFQYSEVLHQVVTVIDGRITPVIEADLKDPPQTKKADIEKSDDQKDRRMWG